MVTKSQRQRGFKTKLLLHYRKARFMLYSLGQVLNPIQLLHLVMTTFWIRPREFLTEWYVLQYMQGMPRVFRPPDGQYLGCIILAVGFGQECCYAYWMAQRLARSYHCKVVVLRTLRNPHFGEPSGQAFQFFYRLPWLNLGWIAEELIGDYKADVPIMAVGFSKGGLDLTVLTKLLLEHHGILVEDIFTLSTPWQGSRLWRKSRMLAGEFFRPGNADLLAMEEIAQSLRQQWQVRFHFYAARRFDQVVHPSDARFRRPPEDHGLSATELKARWYYAQPLWWQYGHTALFNIWAHHQIGRAIYAQLRNRSAHDPAERLHRRQQAVEFSQQFLAGLPLDQEDKAPSR